MKNTIQEGVDSYLKNVVPKTAGQAQILETTRAFYAGAFWVCQIMAGIGAENVSEEAGVMIFDGLIEEFNQYVGGKI